MAVFFTVQLILACKHASQLRSAGTLLTSQKYGLQYYLWNNFGKLQCSANLRSSSIKRTEMALTDEWITCMQKLYFRKKKFRYQKKFYLYKQKLKKIIIFFVILLWDGPAGIGVSKTRPDIQPVMLLNEKLSLFVLYRCLSPQNLLSRKKHLESRPNWYGLQKGILVFSGTMQTAQTDFRSSSESKSIFPGNVPRQILVK